MKVHVLLVVITLLFLLPSGANARQKQEASLRIRVIHAQQGKKHFDPRLKDLQRYLKIYQYSSYEMVIDQNLVLKPEQTRGIGLLKGKNLNVTLTTLSKEKATLRLRLFGRSGVMLDTKVSVGRNGLFFIAGPRYQGGVLFISVEAQYDLSPVGERVSEKP